MSEPAVPPALAKHALRPTCDDRWRLLLGCCSVPNPNAMLRTADVVLFLSALAPGV